MSSSPKKGDIVINPSTQRPVKVGSRTWLALVKKGVFEGKYSDPKELYSIEDDTNIEEKIEEINKQLPINEQSVRGRGKYANKIIKRNKTPSVKDTIHHTVKVASQTVAENYEELQEAEDFEAMLENMIMSEMMGRPKTKPKPIKDKPVLEKRYYCQEPEEYDYN